MRPSALSRRAVCAAGLALPALSFAESPMPLPLVELRRYRTHPGMRETLIALFEREFVESQEAVGMSIIGTFREPARPDNFTWLRGFTGMDARARGLNDFYYGPVWQAHRGEANPCLDDNDDVLLMREAWPGAGFTPDRSPRPAPGVGPASRPGGIVARECWPVDAAAFPARFRAELQPRLQALGVEVLAAFVREPGVNNFPRLPVRESEDFFVWFERYPDAVAREAAGARLDADRAWRDLQAGLRRPADILVLEPTRRSRLHG